MSDEITVLRTHALGKAEVLFQRCHTRGKPILTYLLVQVFYTYQQLIMKEILENKQLSQKKKKVLLLK